MSEEGAAAVEVETEAEAKAAIEATVGTGEITEEVEEVEEQEEQEEGGLDIKEWSGLDVMASLCMSCENTGQTTFMLHKIPNFREIIIASFHCEHCGESNNEVTFGGEIQVQGCVYSLSVISANDLDRQVIKSDSASFKIPALDFEIPPMTQKGEISTIEGFLKTAAKNLAMFQAERMEQQPEVGAKVADIIMKLTFMSNGDPSLLPFHVILDDPAGNSYIQNPHAPQSDPQMRITHYSRSAEQDVSLGLQPDKGVFRDDKESNFQGLIQKPFGALAALASEVLPGESNGAASAVIEDADNARLGRNEVIRIPSFCPNCSGQGDSLTAVTDIPHFKEIIIMAFDCSHCGFRNNEVKGGGAVPDKGTEVTLVVSNLDDLKRDVLKSDTAMVTIPELELELQCGTLGGVYTTVEGLCSKIHKALSENNPFALGDSATLHHSNAQSVTEAKQNFIIFMERLMSFAQGQVLPFTISLRDPLGNSFISAPLGSFIPPEMDPALTIVDFERSWDENEDLGLNDISTKDFETGVDHEAPILPDRITHVTLKGADHPTVFAKGIEDATPGGVYFAAARATFAAQGTTEPDQVPELGANDYYQAPSGWSFSKPDEIYPSLSEETAEVALVEPSSSELGPDYGKRRFDDDSHLQFIMREEFGGQRPGFVFRLGSQGLGYYEDRPPVNELELLKR